MSETVTETFTETMTLTEAVIEEPEEEEGRDTVWTRMFTLLDKVIHVFIGLFFVIAALLSLAYGTGAFADGMLGLVGRGLHAAFQKGSAGPTLIIDFISDLLLTLIIMEVLGTVVQYLRNGETSLKPFIFIGIVSATRGILAVGARLSVNPTLTDEVFRDSMIELGVNAAVIIALGVTLHLLRHYLSDRDRGARRVLISEPRRNRAGAPPR